MDRRLVSYDRQRHGDHRAVRQRGRGRDYTTCPVAGIYSGKGATDLDVVVEVTRLA